MGTYRNALCESAGDLYMEPWFAEKGFTRVPVVVQWMATHGCSLSCPHCATGTPTGGNELTLLEVRHLLDEIAAFRVSEFLVTGGEPMDRPDMPEVIEAMRARRLPWTLNTAVFPDAACRQAMDRWPPGFVAVSLDGPQEVHDRFRGRADAHADALRAIAYYRDLTGGNVAAGTTVTRVNSPFLDDTFREVLTSGASNWGLHLMFPEGRARHRPDLQLTRHELRRLLSFVASKRKYFPVTMADEMGYVGDWEPQVRDAPFFCGAGRAQCVVLGNGNVVPCTTLDESASAGNIRNRPLREIWHDAFSPIRAYRPPDKCLECEYLPACAGGCWLQRRHGKECFRDVWDGGRSRLTRAGMAVCLGLGACGGTDVSPEVARSNPTPVAVVERDASAPVVRDGSADEGGAPDRKALMARGTGTTRGLAGMSEGDQLLVLWYGAWLGNSGRKAELISRAQRRASEDPAWRYLQSTFSEKRPKTFHERSLRLKDTFTTKMPSLHLAGWMWRDIAEWCLDETAAGQRSQQERDELRDTLHALGRETHKWRLEIFHEKLDPFLRRDEPGVRHFYLSKAGPRPELRMMGRSHLKHWGTRNPKQITQQHLRAHPVGESMRLRFDVSKHPGKLRRLSPSGSQPVGSKGELDIFDIIKVPKVMGGDVPIIVRCGQKKFRVALPSGTEVTYADVLRLAHTQNRTELRQMATQKPTSCVLVLPALREQLAAEERRGGQSTKLRDFRWRVLHWWLQ